MPKAVARHFDDDEEDDRGMLSAFARRPVDTLAGALAAACTVMILINAVALQQGGPQGLDKARSASEAAAVAPKAEAPKRSELVVQVQTALAERELYDGVVDGLMGQATAAAIRAFEQSQNIAATGEASEKVLAALLTAPMRPRAAAVPARPAPAPRAAAAATPVITGSTAGSDARLMATQKALAKIGYGPVSVDGKMGTETRNAIKAFERDRNLPETGELSAPMLRALQSLTGASLQ